MGSVGKTLGRVGTGIATGGISEIARGIGGTPGKLAETASNYYLPVAGGIAGGLMGGPTGAMIGGSLGSFLNGQNGLGAGLGAAGALSGGMSSALGGSLLGYGLSMNPQVGNVDMPNWNTDQQALGAEKGNQQQLIDSLMGQQRGLYGEQNDLLGQRMQSQRDELMRQLTSGQEGEAFRQKYNNMGLLNSGAFNQGLSNQFSNLAGQQQQDILNQGINQTQGLSDILNQGYGVQSGLGQAGLQRQFGLEDSQTQFNIAKAIENAQLQSQQQSALLGGGAYMLGGGMGGGGAAGGGSAGGGMFSGLGDMLSNLLGKFRGGGGGTGSGSPGTIGDYTNQLNLNPYQYQVQPSGFRAF